MPAPLLAAGYVLLSLLVLWAAVRLERRRSSEARRLERLHRRGRRFVAAVEAGDLRAAEAELARWFATANERAAHPRPAYRPHRRP
jgi:hypothetical protein